MKAKNKEVVYHQELNVDEEFKSIMYAQSVVEKRGLEDMILKDNIREPIVINKDKVIVDGHTRYAIAVKNSLLPVPTVEMDFESRADTKLWIIQNQLSRRNLSKDQRAVMGLNVLLVFEEAAQIRKKIAGKKHGAGIKKTDEEKDKSRPLSSAEEAGLLVDVSGTYIGRAKFVNNSLPDSIPLILSGKINLNSAFKNAKKISDKEEETKKDTKKSDSKGTKKTASKKGVKAPNKPSNGDSDSAKGFVKEFFKSEEKAGAVTKEMTNNELAKGIPGKELKKVEHSYLLVPNNTEKLWFQKLLRTYDSVCHIEGWKRCLFYHGSDSKQFALKVRKIGFVYSSPTTLKISIEDEEVSKKAADIKRTLATKKKKAGKTEAAAA